MSSLDKIVGKIIGDAKEEAARILNEAKSIAASMEEEAKKKADEVVQAEVSKFRQAKEEEVKRAVMEARIKAKERWLKEREALINQAIDKVKERLARLVGSPDYAKSLEALIEEAAVAIGGGDLLVQLNERDAKLSLDLEGIAKRVKEKTGVDTKIQLSEVKVQCMGGAVVSTRDGSFIYDNTLESRVRRQESALRLTAAKILFA
ncbi:MAG: hypothetical protein DRJ98_03585 [Thermoprotei archaeon]|nr:MAG: hypothetical protein DRJ98_03585 [Thermoprotei archaeon]RLF18539.1 MAG: hypothetical protein DRN06_01250 [Thermoprotei archaeon]